MKRLSLPAIDSRDEIRYHFFIFSAAGRRLYNMNRLSALVRDSGTSSFPTFKLLQLVEDFLI